MWSPLMLLVWTLLRRTRTQRRKHITFRLRPSGTLAYHIRQYKRAVRRHRLQLFVSAVVIVAHCTLVLRQARSSDRSHWLNHCEKSHATVSNRDATRYKKWREHRERKWRRRHEQPVTPPEQTREQAAAESAPKTPTQTIPPQETPAQTPTQTTAQEQPQQAPPTPSTPPAPEATPTRRPTINRRTVQLKRSVAMIIMLAVLFALVQRVEATKDKAASGEAIIGAGVAAGAAAVMQAIASGAHAASDTPAQQVHEQHKGQLLIETVNLGHVLKSDVGLNHYLQTKQPDILILTETKHAAINEDPHSYLFGEFAKVNYCLWLNGPSRRHREKRAKQVAQKALAKTTEYKDMSAGDQARAARNAHVEAEHRRPYGGVAIIYRKEWEPYFHAENSADGYSIHWSLKTDTKHTVHGAAVYGNNSKGQHSLNKQYEQLQEYIVDRKGNTAYDLARGDEFVMMGDFNAVREPELDRCTTDMDGNEVVDEKQTEKQTSKSFCALVDAACLTDAFRLKHDDTREYTRSAFNQKTNQTNHSRIDGALVSEALTDKVDKCTIHSSAETWASTDHRRVTLMLDDIDMRPDMRRSYTKTPPEQRSAEAQTHKKVAAKKLRSTGKKDYRKATNSTLPNLVDTNNLPTTQVEIDECWEKIVQNMQAGVTAADCWRECTYGATCPAMKKTEAEQQAETLDIHTESKATE